MRTGSEQGARKRSRESEYKKSASLDGGVFVRRGDRALSSCAPSGEYSFQRFDGGRKGIDGKARSGAFRGNGVSCLFANAVGVFNGNEKAEVFGVRRRFGGRRKTAFEFSTGE